MCGISGFIGTKVLDRKVINRTLNLMKNRGPDYQDSVLIQSGYNNIYLLHSRLSIIDLDKRSNQPFSVGNYTIIYNGEIYNYIELRKNLEDKGHRFKTQSDTEVLLKYYIQYGPNCVKKFNGMWAFAIWDNNKKELFLSRDRFAEKPLYYFWDQNGFFFGSEIKFIKSLTNNKLEVNYSLIKRYLVFGYKYIYDSPDTYFKGIKELPFASNAKIDQNLKYTEKSYWTPQINIKNMSIDDAIEGSKFYLQESVRRRLRADVGLAFCLSGGIDSSALASIAKKVFNYDVATFSIIDDDERYNEQGNIELTINDINCDNQLIKLETSNMLERLKDLISYHDSPIATISYLVHSILSEKINQSGYKIAISGTGADEFFTGYYDHFNLYLYEMRHHKKFDKFLQEWEKYTGRFIRNPYLKNPRLYFNDQTIREHNHLNSHVFDNYLIEKFSYNIKEKFFSESLLRNRMLNELFYEVTRVILHEDDLNSMRYSLENRSPYLDIDLFNFVSSIPNEYLIQDGFGKYILRQAVKDTLNDGVRLDRKKKGFNASINSIINLNDNNIKSYLLSDSPVYDIIKKDKIEDLINMDSFPNSYNKYLFNFLNTKIFLEGNC